MDTSKLILEIALFLWVVTLLIKFKWSKVNQKILWIVTLGTLVTNVALYYFNIEFLTKNYYWGLPEVRKYAIINFEIIKWTVLSYFCTRFALTVRDQIKQKTGFSLEDKAPARNKIPRLLLVGLISSIIVTVVVLLVPFIYYWIGLLNISPLKIMQPIFEEMRQFAIFGGIRNLFGEEIIARLGVQTVILYHLGKRKYGGFLAVVLSAAYFTLWHDGFGNINLLNFAASLVFGTVYSSYRYEAAAVAHWLADWMLYLAVPFLITMLVGLF
jgi:hypothetical protein